MEVAAAAASLNAITIPKAGEGAVDDLWGDDNKPELRSADSTTDVTAANAAEDGGAKGVKRGRDSSASSRSSGASTKKLKTKDGKSASGKRYAICVCVENRHQL